MMGKQRNEGGEDVGGVPSAIVQLVIGLVLGVVMFLIMKPLI